MTPTTFAAQRHRDTGFVAALVVAAMLLSHPYTGIRHDGILYFGDALARLVGGDLHRDLYFFYGSQGRFTLLPAAYAALIDVFGIGPGTLVGLGFAFALQAAAILYVVGTIAPRDRRVFAALSVVLGWSLYGGLRIFAYGEPFLTARSVAEPLVLIGIGALLRGRLVACALALVAALAVHPLMALGGVVVAWVLVARERPRWWGLAGLAVAAFVVLGLVGLAPFDQAFARYDDAWLALVQEANPQAFVTRWAMADAGPIAYSVIVLAFAIRLLDGSGRRIAEAALAAGLLCSAISFVAVDGLHNPLFGKLQVWRALWLTQWFAMALLPAVVERLWARGEASRIAASLLVIGWLAPFTVAPPFVAAMAVALVAVDGRVAVTATTTRIVVGLAVLTALIVAGQGTGRAIKLGMLLDEPTKAIVGQVLAVDLVVAAIAVGLWMASRRRPTLAAALVACLVVGALLSWDQRTPWTRRMEAYPLGTNIWPSVVEPQARVYWYRDLIAPWILLGHANYYTQQQGSGAVFSRDMMVELDKRRRITSILDFQEQICRMMNGLNEKADSCEPDAQAVRSVCVDGAIDYVVLQSGLDGAKPAATFATGVVENGYEKRFFLYRCAALASR